ncbi:unnamed protein product [Arctogadus glacialis]
MSHIYTLPSRLTTCYVHPHPPEYRSELRLQAPNPSLLSPTQTPATSPAAAVGVMSADNPDWPQRSCYKGAHNLRDC